MKRTQLLRQAIFDIAPAVCPERARLITQSYRESEGQPTIFKVGRQY